MKSLFVNILLLLLLFQVSNGNCQEFGYYLKDPTYASTIPRPSSVLKYEVGKWHVSHDLLLQYMYALDKSSDRALWVTTGKTYEDREQGYLLIGDPNLIAKKDQIIKERTEVALGKRQLSKDDPVVVWLGFSIHGNEPSGSNASMLLAYHLCATNDIYWEKVLKNTLILIDPSLNPDGLQHFSGYVNHFRSFNTSGISSDFEFNEPWPRSRTNHYWFDLNRDWLYAVMPESRARLNVFHDWHPVICTDHHEMGTQSTFFFQPGVPSRTNPLTSKENQEFTYELAKMLASAFDEEKRLYYSKEDFDDFFYGKGSTFPDINGSIGILFEQASSRGHYQKNKYGGISFPFTIKNHLIAALQTIKSADSLREQLNSYQNNFFKTAIEDAKKEGSNGYLLSSPEDPSTIDALEDLLRIQRIEHFYLEESVQSKGIELKPSTSLFIPLNQIKKPLIQAFFQELTQFEDSLFYDISAWTLPKVWNLHFEKRSSTGLKLTSKRASKKTNESWTTETLAIAGNYQEYDAPALLFQLLKEGYQLLISQEPFQISTETNTKNFPSGSWVLLLSNLNSLKEHRLNEILKMYSVSTWSIGSGFSTKGPDLGSSLFIPLQIPKVGVVVGPSFDVGNAGEVWHYIDQKLNYEVSILHEDQFISSSLMGYTTLILPSGSSSKALSNPNLKQWLIQGGNLICIERSIEDLEKQSWITLKNHFTPFEKDSLKRLKYANRENDRGALQLGGALFKVEADLSHPLLFGYTSNEMYVFRTYDKGFTLENKPYSTPLLMDPKGGHVGYVHSSTSTNLKNSAALLTASYGRGRITSFLFNPVFRGYCLGTEKQFSNAILFGSMIKD